MTAHYGRATTSLRRRRKSNLGAEYHYFRLPPPASAARLRADISQLGDDLLPREELYARIAYHLVPA